MRHHFVRSLAGSRDPNFKNVTLLLHGDGTNGGQNNTFLDSSASNNAITRTGNVTQGSFSPYGDRWSNYFDGTGDYLVTAANTAFQLGTGDFSVDLWFYQIGSTASIGTRAIFGIGNNGQTGDIQLFNWWPFGGNPANTLALNSSAGGTLVVTNTAYIPNTWNHVAISRASGVVSIYLNGVRVANASFTTNASYNILTIGRPYTNLSQEHWLGYISNFRLVKGVALYSGTNINVPTSPLSAIANTSILTCQSNRFRDASSNNFTITRNGDVSVQRFSPLSPDAEYRTDRIAGSAYFDGSDYLLAANRALRLASGFFTAECWVYLSSSPASDFSGYTIFSDYYWSGGNTGGYFVTIGNNGKVNLFASSGTFNTQSSNILASNNSITHGQWNHIAIVRGAGDLINIYINGVSTTTPIARTSLQLSSGGAGNHQSMVGARVHDTVSIYGGFIGIISDVRVINGKCLYTANFTPPTEPLTAIPETTFLGRFANGSIVDNAMMNNWETVNSTQISTSIKKYGTGSIYNPAGSSLRVNSIAPNAFGTGDFTVEFWLYPLGTQFGTPISNWTGPGNWAFLFEGQQITFSGPAAGYQVFVKDPTNITLNQWTHIAVSRASGTMRLFRNGIVVASAANSTNFTAAGQLSIGSLYGDGASWQFNGYFDDIRITSGIARYTSDFAPPTAPLPDF